MYFRNLQLYSLPSPWKMPADALEQALSKLAFVPPTSCESKVQGWAPPLENGQYAHIANGQVLIRLKEETKLLPTSVINQVAKAKAGEIEEAQGFALGRKAMKELKERVADELLPRAFSVPSDIQAWIDPINGWLGINSASKTKADDLVKHLLKTIEAMPLESLRLNSSPSTVMTAWLDADEAPAGFTIDMDATMRATGDSKAAVSYKSHALDPDDIRRHIAAGKQCERLAMTWRDKISFVMAADLSIRSIKLLDVLHDADLEVKGNEERFDGNMVLFTGEVAAMLKDLTDALGGRLNTTPSEKALISPEALSA